MFELKSDGLYLDGVLFQPKPEGDMDVSEVRTFWSLVNTLQTSPNRTLTFSDNDVQIDYTRQARALRRWTYNPDRNPVRNS